MKITKSQLRKVIKEELLKEAGGSPGRQFGGSMADLDADAKMRETDFLNPDEEARETQGISDEGLGKAVMMVRDILDIVDHKSESGQLILRLYEFLQRGY